MYDYVYYYANKEIQGIYVKKREREKEKSMRSIDTSASCRVPWFKHTMSGHVIGEPQPS